MATHWTDRRAASAVLAHALRDAGWKLYGYHSDKSDNMTDYYDPARWDGVATKGGAVVVVLSHDNRMSGEAPDVRDDSATLGPCSPCGGSGKEARDYTGSRSVCLISGAVHVEPGHKAGDPCRWCKGTGQREEFRTHKGETWPTYQANAKGRNWHVEIGGRVVASGVGVLELASEQYAHNGSPKTDALVARIEAAASGSVPRPLTLTEGIPTTPTSPCVTFREGKRPGFVEIVFNAKPDEPTRDALKGAGFRWAPSSACWYGKSDAIPAGIVQG